MTALVLKQVIMVLVKVPEEEIGFIRPEHPQTFFLGTFHQRCPMTFAFIRFHSREDLSAVGACNDSMIPYQ
jgi:hypothetical protein